MGYTLEVNNIWKWLTVDWSTLINYYWQDFNPTNPSLPSTYSDVWTYWTTTNFDLSWFQPWHEVWCYVWEIRFTDSYSWDIYWEFLRSSNGWVNWESLWQYGWSISWSSNSWRFWWMYFWVDFDEIWDWYSHYKVYLHWVGSGLSNISEYSPTFTVSNLSIDSTDHYSWYMWVEWSHLCYVDASHYIRWNYGREWFKHKIAYDGNFSEFVWTDYSWKIWLENNVARRIYYVDRYWYKRRTYEARNRYGYTSWQWYRPSNAVEWSIYVSDWWYEDWYAHLCFVNSNWYLMRILNWPPGWIA